MVQGGDGGMSESKVNKLTLVIVFLIGLITGGVVAYMAFPPQRTVVETVEVPVTNPGDPVTVEKLREEMSGVITLLYGAIGASLIAALAAIVSLMQISRSTA